MVRNRMSTQSRPFDLVVFGATAFTGRIAAEYLSKTPKDSLRWAIAGRNATVLQALSQSLNAHSNPPSLTQVLDHSDIHAVQALVAQTRVALTFAGPFARYGEPIIAACAAAGTHYLDITGETLWVAKMIEKYEATAKSTGAILIPFSGFDSVPSDLGVWKVLQATSRSAPDRRVTKVTSLFSMRGGLNGGTFATVIDALEQSPADRTRFQDAALLVPAAKRSDYAFRDAHWPMRVGRVMAPPFFMAPINSRVVYRSQALRGESPVPYVELLKMPRPLRSLSAWGVSLVGKGFEFTGRLPGVAKMLERIGPKSGQGPSKSLQESGFFSAEFFAYSGNELVSRFKMAYDGDPGNRATIVLSCESALSLVRDFESLPNQVGGFWTPSTALGEVLVNRLVAAGVRMESR